MKLNNLKLGQRLGLGFGLVLTLTAVVAALGYVRLEMCQDTMQASSALQDRSILAERWMLLSSSTVAKSTALAKSGFQPQVEAYLAPQLKAGSEEITELAQQLSAQVSSERGKTQLAKIDAARKNYLGVRNEAFRKVKAHEADAPAFVDGEMQQAAAAYVGEIQTLRQMQRTLGADTAKQTNADVDRAQSILLAFACTCVLLGAVLAWRITRSVTIPLRHAASATAAVASGDLSRAITADGKDEVAEVLRGLATMQASLAQIVGQVRASTEGISTASSQIATGNADLSARTEQTAASLQESAASIEQITGTATQSAGSARSADDLARSAADVAGKGGAIVSQVVSTMGEISDASRKIADITGVIDGIAFQTNILALNAAVEAARAGDQGRGFAVVAAEVRTLAQRSAAAAKEIGALIGQSTERVDAGAKLVADAGETMRDIVGSVQRVSQVINEIVTAADEQSRGISEVNAAVARLDQMTQANAALVEESAAAAESLRGQAGSLATVVDTFRLG